MGKVPSMFFANLFTLNQKHSSTSVLKGDVLLSLTSLARAGWYHVFLRGNKNSHGNKRKVLLLQRLQTNKWPFLMRRDGFIFQRRHMRARQSAEIAPSSAADRGGIDYQSCSQERAAAGSSCLSDWINKTLFHFIDCYSAARKPACKSAPVKPLLAFFSPLNLSTQLAGIIMCQSLYLRLGGEITAGSKKMITKLKRPADSPVKSTRIELNIPRRRAASFFFSLIRLV